MLDKIGEAGLVTAGKVIDGIRSGSAKSYVDYTRPSRVEPNLVVDSSLLFYEHTPVVTQSLHSAFSAYYLLAWNMLQASIDNIAVARHLDKLNPNRSVRDSAIDSAGAVWMMSNENFDYSYKLPKFGIPHSLEANNNDRRNNVVDEDNVMDDFMEDAEKRVDKVVRRAVGDAAEGVKNDLKKVIKADNNEKNLMEPGGLVSRSTEVIKEASNLSVGKILEVQISNSGQSKTIPIMIRLNASVMVPGLLAELLTTGNIDNSVSTRWVKYRSGQINFVDLLTARDLNKQHKKNLMQDKTGVYTALASQRRNNKISGLLSLNPSVANSTNLIVTTTETIKKVEMELGGRFDDFRLRQKLFDETGLFIVAVVDQEYDRVKFYTTDIPTSSDLSIRECNASNKKEGASITDILKAYQLGNAPGF